MIIRVRGIKRVRSKGRVYYYHRRSGRRIQADPGTPEFAAEVAAMDRSVTEERTDAIPGSWGWLVEQYRRGNEWTKLLAPRTVQDYQRVFDYLADPKRDGGRGMRDVMLDTITPPHMIRLRDRAHEARGRRMADYCMAVISLVWNWGKPRGLVPGINPTDDIRRIKRPRNARPVNRPWSDAEITAVLDAASPQIAAAVALAAYTGLREGDVLRLPKSARDGGYITLTTSKTGADVHIREHRDLTRYLDALPPNDSPQLITSTRGTPWTESGFRASFFRLIRRLHAEGRVDPGLTFHGLRHTVATNLANAGADNQTIMAMTTHKSESQVRRYTETADRKRRSDSAVDLLEGRQSGRK